MVCRGRGGACTQEQRSTYIIGRRVSSWEGKEKCGKEDTGKDGGLLDTGRSGDVNYDLTKGTHSKHLHIRVLTLTVC